MSQDNLLLLGFFMCIAYLLWHYRMEIILPILLFIEVIKVMKEKNLNFLGASEYVSLQIEHDIEDLKKIEKYMENYNPSQPADEEIGKALKRMAERKYKPWDF